uniref:Variant surface glycoprotein 1125.4018 n=1 Tax=Trypanosoma brucei TaxID=5691 RepID=M4T1G9_9TRYP|nr:variant surface glycoprotein 307 [Trypanosoma brucei]APD74556.1 variant surface glycoprotein 1125.4018 [Trypanosoma brucei]
MYLTLSIALILALTRVRTDDENHKEFKQLCRVYNLLTAAVVEQKISSGNSEQRETITAAASRTLANVKKLNLTAAEEGKTKVLRDAGQYPTLKKVADDSAAKGYFENVEEAEFQKLREDLEDIENSKGTGETFAKTYGTPFSDSQKEAIRAPLTFMAQAATTIHGKLTAVYKQATLARQQAQLAFSKAVYGEKVLAGKDAALMKPDKPLPDPTTAANFPWGAADDRDAVCKNPTVNSGKAGSALAIDMVCICTKKQATPQQLCGTALTGGSTVIDSSSSQSKAHAAWKALSAACTKMANEATGGDQKMQLTTELASVEAMRGQNTIVITGSPGYQALAAKTHNFFGAFVVATTTASDCDTDDANVVNTGGKGPCIGYSAYLKTAAGIPWINHAKTGHSKLQEADDLFKESLVLLTEVQNIEKQMQSLLLMSKSLTQATQAPKDPKSVPQTVEEQNKCKNATNKTAEGCASIGCDFDTKKAECKPKPGTESTAAGTGDKKDGGNTAKPVCSTIQNQTECEGVTGTPPTGKAKVCGWIEGKCQDSSFLVNKQFALMVSAFVALLFLS